MRRNPGAHAESSARAEFDEVASSMSALCHKLPEQYLAAMRVIGKLASLHTVLKHDALRRISKKSVHSKLSPCAGNRFCTYRESQFVLRTLTRMWLGIRIGQIPAAPKTLSCCGCHSVAATLKGVGLPSLRVKLSLSWITSLTQRSVESGTLLLTTSLLNTRRHSGVQEFFLISFTPTVAPSSNVRLAVSFRYEDAGCQGQRYQRSISIRDQ